MLKCNACGRVDAEIGTCGSFLTCPKAGVPLAPTDIVLHCDLCDVTRVVAAGRVMQGKALTANPTCLVGDCQARAVFLSAVEPSHEPADLKTSSGRTRKPHGTGE